MTSPWTEPGMTLKVTILPAWWNTWWFRSLYLILMIVILRIAYRYRLRVMSDALALRLQERVDERTRLSRELHDTLMQTIEGSRLIVDTATKQQTDPAQHRVALEKLSTWLDRASNEGRAAMDTLRGYTNQQRRSLLRSETNGRRVRRATHGPNRLSCAGVAQSDAPACRGRGFPHWL